MDELITDFLGKPIGRIKKEEDDSAKVTDWLGNPLGSADSKGTRDFIGRPISQNNEPALLLNKPSSEILSEKDDWFKGLEKEKLLDEVRHEAKLQASKEVDSLKTKLDYQADLNRQKEFEAWKEKETIKFSESRKALQKKWEDEDLKNKEIQDRWFGS